MKMLGHAGVLLIAAVTLLGCKDTKPAEQPKAVEEKPAAAAGPSSEIDKAVLAAFGPLPPAFENPQNTLSDAKLNLGRMLYFDTRLSKNHDISCNSCHGLDTYGVDSKKTSEGHRKQLGSRNSPTTYNAAAHLAQFWDGRAKDVEEQAGGPMMNPVEMAMPAEAKVVEVLTSIPEYVKLFKEVYPAEKQPVTLKNAAAAIGAFERKLITPSRWDKFLAGDTAAITDEEKKGFNTFVATGCTQCHNGPAVGGGMYMKLGLVKPWPNQKDLGRFEVTKAEGDKMVFKVPSLRNIEKTGPYFHDGSVATLDEAVRNMAEYQLGKKIDDTQGKLIGSWLKTLTGELPAAYITRPVLPPNGPKTPKPDPT